MVKVNNPLKLKYSLLKSRLVAYSLLEAIVAMLLLLILFFIAIDFFLQANKAGFDIQKMNATNALDEYILLTDQNKAYYTGKKRVNGWMVSREAMPYANGDSLIHIKYVVYEKEGNLTPLFYRNVLRSISSE